MLRSLVAGTVVALILAPAASWSKDPPQQIEVERTGISFNPSRSIRTAPISASSSSLKDSTLRNLPTA